MESDGEDLENIFEEYENDDGAENTENKSSNETHEAVKIAPPKRIVKNPRLKFNAERLCGERGIPILVDHFKNVKFKGPGHEREDLDKLISKLEHWAHRLFPSMKFEDCLTHIERLGKKRPVQTCLRKIRLDMPILCNDFVKDNEDDDVKRNDDSEPEEINAFDRLLSENGEISSIDVSAPENISNSSVPYSSPMPNSSRSYVLGSSFESSLTDEQKERMERNKMLAAERRKARLAAMEASAATPLTENLETASSESALSEQNSFNKLLDSSECNNKNVENSNSDFEESSKMSSDLNCENSEKLGLDDLMNLVDEEDPASDGNSVASPSEQIVSISGRKNETNKFLQDDDVSFKNLDDISENTKNKTISSSKNSETSLEENLNVESSLNLVCETFIESKADADYSVKGTSACDESVIMENRDLTYMDCEENADSGCSVKGTAVNDEMGNKDLTCMDCEVENS